MSAPLEIPPPPEDSECGTGSSTLRFEDVAQDGRLRLEGVWPPIGPILWNRMEFSKTLARLGQHGVRAVLTRVVMQGGDDPLSVRNRCEHEVRFRLAHTVDEQGQPNRLIFDTWLDSFAPRGHENNPGAPSSGPRVRVAHAYGQHVFTRPAAPAGKHRVTAFEDPELPAVPPARTEWLAPGELLWLPEDAEPLEPAFRPDAAPIVFGLCHTDGNQHVNFLAYPRLAEEAALRRAKELGHDARLLARRADVGYRKPGFAGEPMRLVLRAYRRAGRFGIVGAFLPEQRDFTERPEVDAARLERPHCVVRLELST